MSGDWIKMRGNLWDDPRVGRICDLTGCKEAAAVGALYWLWAAADQHTEDGCMPGLSLQQIDRKTGVKGFAAALVDVGWLADDPQGAVIKHFEEHNGASAKKRAQTAKRVAKLRTGNADVAVIAANGNAASVTGALAREEIEREEEKDSVAVATAAAAAHIDVAAAQIDRVEAVFTLGIPLLTSAGVPEKNARSFLGRLRKFNADGAIVAAIDRCAKAVAAQPVEFLQGCLRTSNTHVNRQEALERSNRAVGEAWLRKEEADARP